ncbi:hypothetical protein HN766_16685 [Candidatus Poribacteria bacterium]|jgi:hypothetical protein|nr:hypothetical protein [Candidatus Poribacteria bacterium]
MKSAVSSKKGRSPSYGWLAAPLCLLFALLVGSAHAQVLSVADVSVAEDVATATFTVTLTGASGSYSYSVDYLAADGTATTADGDYTAASGTLNFSDGGPNTTTATVDVTLGVDTLDEADETFTLTLSNVAGGATLDGAATVATGTITNDDVPAITIADITVDEISGSATLAVTLSNASTADVTVQADTTDGTATIADADYNAIAAQTVTVTAGSTSAAITVTINDDTTDEPDETLTVDLSSPAGGATATPPTITDASGTVTVTNDDVPTISIADVAVSEISGLAQAVVTLSNASTADVTVVADTADGTATTADSDYTAVVTTTVTIAAGTLTSTADVTIADDATKEINETLTITLSAPGGGATGVAPTITDGTAVVTILNDDDALPATSMTVNVDDTSSAIDGALVSIFESDTSTPATVADADPHKLTVSGAVTFAGLLEGATYHVAVSGGSLGYLTNTATVAAFDGAHTETVSLTTTSVIVLVQDEAGSPAPIVGATVAIDGLSAVTDGSGNATIAQVPTKAGPEDAGNAPTDLTISVTGPADTGSTRYQDASLTPVTVLESGATDLTSTNPITLSNVQLTVTITGEDSSGAQAALDGATVTLTGPETVSIDTSGGGIADFGAPAGGGGILAGDYAVTVVEPGYVTSADPAVVSVTTAATGTLGLALDYTSLTIHVSSGGIDISGVAVAVALDGGGSVTPPRTIPSPAETDAGGLVELRGIDGTAAALHTFTMSKAGFVTSTLAGKQISDTASTGTVDVLTPAITVDVDDGADPLDGVTITVSGPSGTFTAVTNTTPTTVGTLAGTVGPGQAVFPTLLAGDYTVTASLDGWVSAQQTPVTLTATTQSTVALSLAETQLTLTVSAIDVGDDVTVTLPGGANAAPLVITADASSKDYVFTGATGGEYDAVVTGAGYENLTVPVVIDATPGATVTTATGALVKNTVSIAVTPEGSTVPAPFVDAGGGTFTATKVLVGQSVDITKLGYITQAVDLAIDANGVLDAQQSAASVAAVALEFTSLTVSVTETTDPGGAGESTVASEGARVVLLVFDSGAGSFITASGSVAGDAADKLTVTGEVTFTGFDAAGSYQLNISQEGFTPRLGLAVADDTTTNVEVSPTAPVTIIAVLLESLTLDFDALPTIYRGESYSVGSIVIPTGVAPFTASVTSEDAPNVFDAFVQGDSIQISGQAADTKDVDAGLTAVNMTLSFADSSSPPTGGTTTLTAQVDNGIGVFDAYTDSINRGGDIVVALRNVGASRTVDLTITPTITGLTMPTGLITDALGEAAAGDVEAIITIPADAPPAVYTIGAAVSGIDLDGDASDDVPAGAPATVDIVVIDTLSAVSISSVDPTLITGISGGDATVTVTMLTDDEASSVEDIQLVDPSGTVALAAPVSAGGSANILTFVVPQAFASGIYTLHLDAQGPTGVAGGVPTGQYVAIADAIEDGWQSSLSITTTDGFSRTVFFGAAVNATTGFNAQEDVPLPPDEPQRLVTTMVFRRAGAPSTGLLRDVVATSSIAPPNPDPVLTWQVDVLVPDPQTGALSWSSDFLNGTLAGYFDNAFIDLPNGDTLDMRNRGAGTGTISLPPGSHTLTLRLERSDADHTLTLGLGEGWTAVSLPGPPDAAIATIGSLRNALGANTIWQWDAATQSYARPLSTDLVQHVDTAYFVHRASAADVDVAVNIDTRVARQVTVPIDAGWNFVGAIEADPSSNQLNDAFSTGPNSVFEYDPATQNYAVATALAPGRGYWVLATGADSVVFAQPQHRNTVLGNTALAAPTLSDLSWSTRLSLESADAMRSVDIGVSPLATTGYDLYDIAQPPPPADRSASVFYADVDHIASRLTRSVQPLSTDGGEWTLTARAVGESMLRWDPVALEQGYRLWIEVGDTTYDMNQARRATVPDGIQRFRVFATWTPPSSTRLLANYPNPFNPETWIPFELETASDVTVHIYDMRGSVVRTLELGYREAGYYTEHADAGYWDGRNDLGERVGSGAYVYALKAGGRSTMRRMVILK